MRTYVLLVAGYEYKNGDTNLATFCERRAQYLLEVHPAWRNDPDLAFVLFDVKSGVIRRGSVANGAMHWQTENDSFTALSRTTHYEGSHFKQQETRVMSITDVYRYVTEIGSREGPAIAELSILGHGWMGGPVLVNSFEREEYKTGAQRRLRDPWEKDGRVKDTNEDNMDAATWRHFIHAFKPDSHIWIWGCAATRMYKSVVDAVVSSREFRNKAFGKHADTDTFTLSFSQSFAQEYFQYDALFFQRQHTAGPVTALSFQRTLREVKDYLIRGVCHAYCGVLAYNSRLKVYGAWLGTGSDYERRHTGNSRFRHLVMEIPRRSDVYGYSFSGIVSFYKTYLRIAEDPEGRGYAFFDPAVIEQWKGNAS